MQHVFIIGSRGLPAKYGGFETFVEELVKNKQSSDIVYHVACLSDDKHHTHFKYEGADCFTIKAPKIGPARVIAYDMMAITYGLQMVKRSGIEHPIFYILGNTIGAFIAPFAWRIHALGGKVYVNPDGLEWKRSKWSKPVQAYLTYAEKSMAKTVDLVISDNIGIENYIKESYPDAKTRFIAYGTDLKKSTLTADDYKVRKCFDNWKTKENGYYLIVGRFVPENNYETAIREFMKSNTRRDLIIISNHKNSAYFDKLKHLTNFERDHRVKFVGTVYDRDLLNYIRENAFAYIHGHEVGGTNPGLLEALGHTKLNLVLDVPFNKSVAGASAFYWNKTSGNLSCLINDADGYYDFTEYGNRARAIVKQNYTWEKIVGEYEGLFLNED
ncbi:beta 1-4 rhamnosyltransferase Cps2T [Streptococcus infantarius]|uniref:beta 1-4 rhamnosyltransferase Cps2T n=1 Tax=Streptococcus infantarius TaxID=102684 RepID=UPI00336A6DDB